MSNPVHRSNRAKRLGQKQRSVRRQVLIAKTNGMNVDEPHRYAKRSAMDCGNPKCIWCSNGGQRERTIQELKSFDEMEIDYE